MSAAATRATFLLALLLITPAVASPSDEVIEGLPIVNIRVDSYDIFDLSNPKTKAWPYRWANALHIISKEDFIRSMLLFKEGDPYCESAAAESARILRGLGIMNPVEISGRRVPGGVEVTVETGQAARITVQDYFLRYEHLGGMTGTARSSASELKKIYKVNVFFFMSARTDT